MTDERGDEVRGDELSEHDAEQLLAALRSAATAADDVPAAVTLAARSAIAHRRLDAALAELLHDSAELPEDAQLAGVRGTARAERRLSFTDPDHPEGFEADVEVQHDDGPDLRLLGQVVAGEASTVTLQTPGDAPDLTVTVDAHGGFEVGGLTPGALRLVVELADRTVVTPWVRL